MQEETRVLYKLHMKAARTIKEKWTGREPKPNGHGHYLWFEKDGSVVHMDDYNFAIHWDDRWIGTDWGGFIPHATKAEYGELLKFLMLENYKPNENEKQND